MRQKENSSQNLSSCDRPSALETGPWALTTSHVLANQYPEPWFSIDCLSLYFGDNSLYVCEGHIGEVCVSLYTVLFFGLLGFSNVCVTFLHVEGWRARLHVSASGKRSTTATLPQFTSPFFCSCTFGLPLVSLL